MGEINIKFTKKSIIKDKILGKEVSNASFPSITFNKTPSIEGDTMLQINYKYSKF